jgi:hypothetical protein
MNLYLKYLSRALASYYYQIIRFTKASMINMIFIKNIINLS